MSPTDVRLPDDGVLAGLGHQRKIALNVLHWPWCHTLKKTDLLAVMPRHLATALMDDELRMEELPIPVRSILAG